MEDSTDIFGKNVVQHVQVQQNRNVERDNYSVLDNIDLEDTARKCVQFAMFNALQEINGLDTLLERDAMKEDTLSTYLQDEHSNFKDHTKQGVSDYVDLNEDRVNEYVQHIIHNAVLDVSRIKADSECDLHVGGPHTQDVHGQNWAEHAADSSIVADGMAVVCGAEAEYGICTPLVKEDKGKPSEAIVGENENQKTEICNVLPANPSVGSSLQNHKSQKKAILCNSETPVVKTEHVPEGQLTHGGNNNQDVDGDLDHITGEELSDSEINAGQRCSEVQSTTELNLLSSTVEAAIVEPGGMGASPSLLEVHNPSSGDSEILEEDSTEDQVKRSEINAEQRCGKVQSTTELNLPSTVKAAIVDQGGMGASPSLSEVRNPSSGDSEMPEEDSTEDQMGMVAGKDEINQHLETILEQIREHRRKCNLKQRTPPNKATAVPPRRNKETPAPKTNQRILVKTEGGMFQVDKGQRDDVLKDFKAKVKAAQKTQSVSKLQTTSKPSLGDEVEMIHPASNKDNEKIKSTLLNRHLEEFQALLKVQPRRHTEEQLRRERAKKKKVPTATLR